MFIPRSKNMTLKSAEGAREPCGFLWINEDQKAQLKLTKLECKLTVTLFSLPAICFVLKKENTYPGSA